MTTNNPKGSVGVVTLGCDKNRVDTEKILAKLVKNGYEIVADISRADFILINTCAFIRSATKESVDTVLEAYSVKKPGAKIIVAGCFTERYAAETAAEFSEVDAFVGINRYDDIVSVLENAGKERLYLGGAPAFYGTDRIITTPAHYAYLKIAEGCSNRCTYCAIPKIRGGYRSEKEADVLKEAEKLCEDGVKELIVVAQDTTRYGSDLGGETNIARLLKKLCGFGFRKIRLMYSYPESVTDELIDVIANEPVMAKYADIPLQHVSGDVLKRMNRRSNPEQIYALLEKLRKAVPGIAVRSTFIVGFPGETEKDYLELKDFIGAGNIDYAGFFAYSKEEGTAAALMSGQIPYKIKKAREKELSRLQCAVIKQRHGKYAGKTLEAVYEGVDYAKGRFVARSEYNAPEIDTVIFLTSDCPLEIGEYYDVKITGTGFHLSGEAIRKKDD